MSGNKVLARALVKIAVSEDKQVAINAAEASQFCGANVCNNPELTQAESQELKEWIALINTDEL